MTNGSPAPFDPSGHESLHPAFGEDPFGQAAAFSLHWDPYPFILLNLAFSTQAAYAAPLILLAQTRQADRDKALEESAGKHRDQLANAQQAMLEQNTRLTEEVARLAKQIDELTRQIHKRVVEQS